MLHYVEPTQTYIDLDAGGSLEMILPYSQRSGVNFTFIISSSYVVCDIETARISVYRFDSKVHESDGQQFVISDQRSESERLQKQFDVKSTNFVKIRNKGNQKRTFAA